MSSLISDNQPTDPQGPPPAGQPGGPQPSELAETPEVQEPERVESFDREYVETLRRESAGYRTQLRDYEQVFEGMDRDERDAYLAYIQLSRQAANGDQEAISTLAEAGLWEEPDTTPQPEAGGILSEQQVQELIDRRLNEQLSARDNQVAEQSAIRDVQNTAKGLGYEVGSERYVLLLHYANQMETPDLAEAHKQVEAYDQQIIQKLMDTKTADGRNSLVLPSSPGGTPNVPAAPPKDWAEARERMGERLGNR